MRLSPFVLSLLSAACWPTWAGVVLAAAQPPAKEPTEDQKVKLRERDRYDKEGVELERQGRLREAVAVAKKMLAIERSVLATDHPDIVGSLQILARLHERLEEFATARQERAEALAIQTKLHGEKSWLVTNARLDLKHTETLGRLSAEARRELREAGQFLSKARAAPPIRSEEGIDLATKALAVHRRLLGSDDRLTAFSAFWVGKHWVRANQPAKALASFESALAALQKTLGEHPDTANCLRTLGDVAQNANELSAARRYYEQALAVRKKALGEIHPEVATDLHVLATLLRRQQDSTTAATAYLEQALAICRKTRGPADLFTAGILNDLGARGKRAYLEEALAIRRKVLGNTHPDTGHTLYLLGIARGGEPDKARAYLEEALAICKGTFGEHHPNAVLVWDGLGQLALGRQDYAAAEKAFTKILEIRRKALGEQHPDVAESLYALGHLNFLRGDRRAARPLYERALAMTQRTVEEAAYSEPEREQLRLTRRLGARLDIYLSMSFEEDWPAEAAYAPLLTQKGAVFANQLQFRFERDDPALAPLLKEWHALSRQFALVGGFNAGTDAFVIGHRREEVERALVRKRQKPRQGPRAVAPADVRRALPADTVLIDFVVYKHAQPRKGKAAEEERLNAFVLRPGAKILRLNLGPISTVESAINAWRDNVRRREPAPLGQAGAELRRLLWEPLEPHLRGAKLVLVSPDHALGRVPFAALPGKRPGSYLLEEYPIAVVLVSRLLPGLGAPTAAEARGKPALLLVGDVDFDAAPGGEPAEEKGPPPAPALAGDGKWDALPGARAEIEALAAACRKAFGPEAAAVLRGAGATEAALRRRAGPRWLHLATHGFSPRPPRKARWRRAGI